MRSRWDSFITSFAGRIQPLGLAAAIDDRTLMARVAFGVFVGGVINVALLVLTQFWFGETTAASVSTAQLAITLFTGLAMFRTGRAIMFANWSLWSAVFTVITIHILLGGFAWSGGYLLWGISNVVMAATWLTVRSTTWMATLYLAVAITFGLMEPTIQSWRERPDPNLATFNTILIFVTTVALIAPAVVLMRRQIFDERARARGLLLSILPERIADQLQQESDVIAERHDQCTVLFADLVGFTTHSRAVEPERLVAELNAIFTSFDHIVVELGGEKIKTIGDGYMAAFGVPDEFDGHEPAACRAALEIVGSMSGLNNDLETSFQVRVGVATGPVVAGVIGETKFSYDLWSDTVILASRLESVADAGQILVSKEIADHVTGFGFQDVGSIDLKGRGLTPAFALVRAEN